MTLATALYGGGGIKSIQAGTITLNGVASNTATISSVDTSKSVVFYGGSSVNTTNITSVHARLSLTNATTVTATRDGTSFILIASYTVVEFN